ncbi:MAG: hypothetical protein AAF366_03430 [Pseudomonadota bacterium]
MEPGDRIALAALLLSLFTLGWQVRNAIEGPDLKLLSFKDRVVELRCIGRSADCWDEGGAPMSIIVPIFAVNTGAAGYNEVIGRATVEIEAEGMAPIHLVAHYTWVGTESGGSDGKPFAPIPVSGLSAAGAEYRFLAFTPENAVPWSSFVGRLTDGPVDTLRVTLTIRLVVEAKPDSRTCTLTIADRHRALLDRIRSQNGKPYLSMICDDLG